MSEIYTLPKTAENVTKAIEDLAKGTFSSADVVNRSGLLVTAFEKVQAKCLTLKVETFSLEGQPAVYSVARFADTITAMKQAKAEYDTIAAKIPSPHDGTKAKATRANKSLEDL